MGKIRYVILLRNPQNDCVTAIKLDNDDLMTWESEEAAQTFARGHMLCKAWPYSIVEAP
jgi:hypothetical protein